MDNLPLSVRGFIDCLPLNNEFLKISFKLDVCLHLEQGTVFEIKRGRKGVIGLIYCEDITEEFDPRFGTGKNVELESDLTGAFRFTKINLLLSGAGVKYGESLPPKLKRDAIYAFNKFIDSYKLVTKRFGVENIFTLEDLGELNILFFYPRKAVKGIHSIRFPGGGITKGKPLLSLDDVQSIKKLTSQPSQLDLVTYFLLDARKYLYRKHDLQALINVVTALELSWKKFYFGLDVKKYTLTQRELRILNKKGGYLGAKIDIVFSKIYKNALGKRIINSAKKAIDERNDIVHEGKRKLKGNINVYIDSIEKVVKSLN